MTKSAWQIAVRSTALALFIFSLIVTMRCWEAYARDRKQLRNVVREVVPPGAAPAERVLALLHWVHDVGGTRKSDSFFVVPALRATPAQVLREGGDCADKSRLLAALLREVGVPATMALCFDRESGSPAHTIVEARIARGEYMVVDPAFDLYFPKTGNSGYHDLLDLRHDPMLVDRRVEALRAASPAGQRTDPFYLRSGAAYETAMTINWSRNFLMRWIRDGLHAVYGERMYRIPRPRMLEEPQLCVAIVASAAGCLAFCVMLLTLRTSRRSDSSRPVAMLDAAGAPPTGLSRA